MRKFVLDTICSVERVCSGAENQKFRFQFQCQIPNIVLDLFFLKMIISRLSLPSPAPPSLRNSCHQWIPTPTSITCIPRRRQFRRSPTWLWCRCRRRCRWKRFRWARWTTCSMEWALQRPIGARRPRFLRKLSIAGSAPPKLILHGIDRFIDWFIELSIFQIFQLDDPCPQTLWTENVPMSWMHFFQ